MLYLQIDKSELYNENTGEFVEIKAQTLQLEHSLVSVSKWESKWKKPFLSTQLNEQTIEETLDYIRCMTITQNVNPNVYFSLTGKHIKEVLDYIDDPMTATTVKNTGGRKSGKAITSELIYYWMTALKIPFECQKWHLNRLLTLIRVCEAESAPPKKMGRGAITRQNAAINKMRRKQLNTKG